MVSIVDQEPRQDRPSDHLLIWIIVGVLVVAWLLVPPQMGGLVNHPLVPSLNHGRQFQLAFTMRALDAENAGEPSLYPADAGIRSFRSLIDRLVAEHYLTESDVKKFRLLEDFELTNFSASDPPETAMIISKPGPFWKKDGFVVFTLNDDKGEMHEHRQDRARIKLPPREPAILPAE